MAQDLSMLELYYIKSAYIRKVRILCSETRPEKHMVLPPYSLIPGAALPCNCIWSYPPFALCSYSI